MPNWVNEYGSIYKSDTGKSMKILFHWRDDFIDIVFLSGILGEPQVN